MIVGLVNVDVGLLRVLPVLYEEGRMVDTWTPQGSSSWRRVLVKRLSAALDAP